MIVTRNKEKCNIPIKIGGHEISHKGCIRYLGVMLDDSLTWKKHCTCTFPVSCQMVVGVVPDQKIFQLTNG